MTDDELQEWHISLRSLQNPTTLRAFLNDDTQEKRKNEPPPLFNADEYV